MNILNLHATYFAATFRRLGHAVLAVGPDPWCDVVLTEAMSLRRLLDLLAAKSFKPDLVLWCDACQVPWVFGFETLPAVTIGFSIDQYVNPWHVPYSAAFDAMLVAQKDYIPQFAGLPLARPVKWFPLFCDPSRDRDPGGPRDVPVSFVGTVGSPTNPERGPFLQEFKRLAPLFATSGAYWPVFGRSRIVLNQSAAGELNFRLFQAMACGAAILTEDAGNGLRELFTPGEDLLAYRRGDAADAARVAMNALADPRLPAIAASGRRKVLARHTLAARAKEILALARGLAASGAPKQRLGILSDVQSELKKAYIVVGMDENLPLGAAHRQFFLDLARP